MMPVCGAIEFGFGAKADEVEFESERLLLGRKRTICLVGRDVRFCSKAARSFISRAYNGWRPAPGRDPVAECIDERGLRRHSGCQVP